jgi:hypothetical protein
MTGTPEDEDMTGTHPEDQEPKQHSSRVNPIAIIAGALASLSAAVVASYFGVAGTLIGTAVVSVVSSVTAVLYAGVLGRTRGVVQRSGSIVHVLSDRGDRQRPARAGGPAPADGEAAGGPAEPVAARAAATGGREPAGGSGGQVGWPWRRSVGVVGIAVLIFAIAIGVLTGIEAAIKEPISSALGVRDRGQASTSVGVAVSRAGGSATTGGPAPSPTTLPSATTQPGQAPSTTQPGPSTTTGGAASSSTAPPTTAQPSPSTSAGSLPRVVPKTSAPPSSR